MSILVLRINEILEGDFALFKAGFGGCFLANFNKKRQMLGLLAGQSQKLEGGFVPCIWCREIASSVCAHSFPRSSQ